MAKKRRYGDAWKDVQIDAEQNDAVFDRFFKKTQPDINPPLAAGEEIMLPPAGHVEELPAPSRAKASEGLSLQRSAVRPPQPDAAVRPIATVPPNLPIGINIPARVEGIKRQYRLSKGEAAVLRYLLDKANENGGSECYAKVPQLAEICKMTHRGCQFALRNLESRSFIVRLKDYDPADRLGIKFRINLPAT